jgi:L-asparagine transporter-like permease
MAGVTAAAATVFFSFIGLDTVATAGEEVRNPTRNVPIGILAALGIVTCSTCWWRWPRWARSRRPSSPARKPAWP